MGKLGRAVVARGTWGIAGAVTLAMILAGCTDSAASSGDGSGAAESGDLQTVRVAALPIADTGAIWGAEQAGVFAEHGFEVEVVTAQGGAQAIPALLSGDIEFAVGQPFSVMRAGLQDLGVVIVSNFADSYADGEDIAVVVVPDGSDISDVADLAGKRVGTNSIGSAGDVTIMLAVDEAGADSSAVEFVEVIMPDAQAQLEAGNIDAALLTDPFSASVVAAGGSILLSPYQEAIPGLSTQVLSTTAALLDEDPELVASFTAAMDDALAWATENEPLVQAALVENMGVSAEVAATLRHSVFSSELSVEDLTALAQIAVDYGVFDRIPDFDRLIQTP